MDHQRTTRFRAEQEQLLNSIRRCHQEDGNTYTRLQQLCQNFLERQKQQLSFLEERRDTHLKEEGKVKFRLVANEQVTVEDLKQWYDDFAKLLEEFIEDITVLMRRSNYEVIEILKKYQQGAVEMGLRMLTISLLLESQPDSTNYDKNQNPIPTLLCLGGQFLCNFVCDEAKCQVTIVSESDLKASTDKQSFHEVPGLKGVSVKSDGKKPKSSKSKSSKSKPDVMQLNLGSWSIPKDQLCPADKGSAHKEWVRLKFNVPVIYKGHRKDLWLLSLPFNIRKGSVQMYTFIGALMWYFYTVEDPYKEFTFPTRLRVSTVLNMLTTRVEVIGRKLSPIATQFFQELLEELSAPRTSVLAGTQTTERMIELETVTRGPPSTKKKQDDQEPPKKTPTVSETIETYGFFTWFYALVQSLETTGYLNKLWMEGYIFDLCTPEYAIEWVNSPTFGFRMVIIRPSMSNIYHHQGAQIHMGFSLFYKTKPGKVITLNQESGDLTMCGLHGCLTYKLPLDFIYMADRRLKRIDDLKDQTTEQIIHYHDTTFRKARGPEVAGSDAITRHCNTCRCQKEISDMGDDEETLVKKPRTPSTFSSIQSPEWNSESRVHKVPSPPFVQSPGGSQEASPYQTTPSSQWSDYGHLHGSTDSTTESLGSSTGADKSNSQWIQTFPAKTLDTMAMTNSLTISLSANSSTLAANFMNAAKQMLEKCSDDVIEKFTHSMMEVLTVSNNYFNMPGNNGNGMQSLGQPMIHEPFLALSMNDSMPNNSENLLNNNVNSDNMLNDILIMEEAGEFAMGNQATNTISDFLGDILLNNAQEISHLQ